MKAGLFTAPKSFQRVIALSPSIWWGGRAILETEAAFAAANKDLPVNLFLSIGALEEIAFDLAAGFEDDAANQRRRDRRCIKVGPALEAMRSIGMNAELAGAAAWQIARADAVR